MRTIMLAIVALFAASAFADQAITTVPQAQPENPSAIKAEQSPATQAEAKKKVAKKKVAKKHHHKKPAPAPAASGAPAAK